MVKKGLEKVLPKGLVRIDNAPTQEELMPSERERMAYKTYDKWEENSRKSDYILGGPDSSYNPIR